MEEERKRKYQVKHLASSHFSSPLPKRMTPSDVMLLASVWIPWFPDGRRRRQSRSLLFLLFLPLGNWIGRTRPRGISLTTDTPPRSSSLRPQRPFPLLFALPSPQNPLARVGKAPRSHFDPGSPSGGSSPPARVGPGQAPAAPSQITHRRPNIWFRRRIPASPVAGGRCCPKGLLPEGPNWKFSHGWSFPWHECFQPERARRGKVGFHFRRAALPEHRGLQPVEL